MHAAQMRAADATRRCRSHELPTLDVIPHIPMRGRSVDPLTHRSPGLVAVLVTLLFLAFGGCAQPLLPLPAETEPGTETVYLITGGWHTDICLSVDAISGPLAAFGKADPGAKYLVFGWGQRDYYMASDPGLGDLLRAASPGPAVMLIIPLRHNPLEAFGRTNAMAIPVSPEGLASLSAYLWREIQKDAGGVPQPITAGPHPDSRFYASTSVYDLTRNCNRWTAEALRIAGVPIRTEGIIFASDVVEQVLRLRTGSGK